MPTDSPATANPVRGEVTIDLPGHPGYLLQPTFDALVKVEEALGQSVVLLANQFNGWEAGLAPAAVVIQHCGAAAGGKLTRAEIGRALMALGVVKVIPRLGAMLTAAVTSPDEEAAKNAEAVPGTDRPST